MQDYQKRMIEEEAELTVKCDAIREFSVTETYKVMDGAEQLRLVTQLGYMQNYREVLRDRINAFKAELWDATQCHAELEFTSELDADAIKMCVRADRRECEHLNHANDSCNLSSMYECSMVSKIERPRIGGE